jgi:hypothetical protein
MCCELFSKYKASLSGTYPGEVVARQFSRKEQKGLPQLFDTNLQTKKGILGNSEKDVGAGHGDYL